MMRGHKTENTLRIGPNIVHAFITHPDGSWDDLGFSHNLLTNVGRDLFADGQGAAGVNNGANVATGSSATSLTDSGEAWTTDRYKGWIVVAEETTNTPVFGNIVSNTGTVLNIDSWKNADDSAGTTPGTTANYQIYPANRARYMALTSDASAANAANTALASEIVTNGGSRALCTYAHTATTATYTLTKAFSISGTLTAIHRIGLLTSLTGTGILVFEAVLNLDATVGNGDTLTVTDTVTLS
jgi:hypothetical protein